MRLIVVTVVGLLCGCGAEGSDAAAADSSAGHSDMGSPAGDLGICAAIKVTPSSGIVPVTLTASTNVSTFATPTWSLQTPSGVVTPVSQDASGLVVSWDATEPGSYIFRLEFSSGGPCVGQGSALVTAPNANSQAYRVRLTPPASSGLPQQDKLITIYGNTPQSDAELVLEAGTSFGGMMHAASGGIAGEVQLFPMSGPEVDLAVGVTGAFSLPIRLDGTYSVVLIPSDPSLAPRIVGPTLGAMLTSAQMLVGAGEPITGLLRDASAAPLAGAHIALRYGHLPSGLGSTAADGTFSIRAQQGTYQLAASADGWPEVTLDGVTVGAGGINVALDQQLARNAVSLRVVRADLSTPVAGAQVTLRSLPITGAAQIDVGAGQQSAIGVAKLLRTSAADGTLGPAMLPSGTFDILVDAADVGSGVPEGTTGLRKVISAAGSIDLVLSAHVQISGTVRDSNGKLVKGARVRAVVSGANGPIHSTTTDAQGAYTITVAAGLPIDLLFDPPAATPLAGARVHLGATDGSMGGALPAGADAVLPPGLQIAGTVRGPNTAPLGGVAVDVLCLSCGDPKPIAHGESDGNGAYVVALPDPGVGTVDGGTD